jgi:hypothetical protein
MLPVAIRCALNILATFYDLPITADQLGLKLVGARYDERCKAIGEFLSDVNTVLTDDDQTYDDSGGGDDEPFRYVTYLKHNSWTGEIYAGRSSGFGSEQDIVARRDADHHIKDIDYGPASPDKSTIANLPVALRHFDPSYQAIRGREQQLIDSNGGAWSDVGRRNTNSGNKIRGVAKDNPMGRIYHIASSAAFGEIHGYRGDR